MRDERYFVGLTEQGISFMSFAWDVTLPLQLNLCVDFEVSPSSFSNFSHIYWSSLAFVLPSHVAVILFCQFYLT